MSTEKHVHKLKKHTFKSGNSVYHCVSDCPFKVSVGLALGKRVVCWRCGKIFPMNEYSLRLVKPHCDACKKPKDKLADEIKSTVILAPEPIAAVDDLRKRLGNITERKEPDEFL